LGVGTSHVGKGVGDSVAGGSVALGLSVGFAVADGGVTTGEAVGANATPGRDGVFLLDPPPAESASTTATTTTATHPATIATRRVRAARALLPSPLVQRANRLSNPRIYGLPLKRPPIETIT
jgi:hypothetical protein